MYPKYCIGQRIVLVAIGKGNVVDDKYQDKRIDVRDNQF